jgi:hypothetical protein
VLKARQLYGEYLMMAGSYMSKIGEAQEAVKGDDVKKLEEINAMMEKAIETYAFQKADFIERMLEVILTKNGYEYNRTWWEENTDYQVMEQFIFQAMKKDDPEDTKPTKKKELN